MKKSTYTAIWVGLLIYSCAFPVVWKAAFSQQQPPAQPQPMPSAQMLADTMQGLTTANSLLMQAIKAYDKDIAQAFADQRAQLMWWQACGADKGCWAWITPAETKP